MSQRALIAKDLKSTNDTASQREVVDWLRALIRERLDLLSLRHFGRKDDRP